MKIVFYFYRRLYGKNRGRPCIQLLKILSYIRRAGAAKVLLTIFLHLYKVKQKMLLLLLLLLLSCFSTPTSMSSDLLSAPTAANNDDPKATTAANELTRRIFRVAQRRLASGEHILKKKIAKKSLDNVRVCTELRLCICSPRKTIQPKHVLFSNKKVQKVNKLVVTTTATAAAAAVTIFHIFFNNRQRGKKT